MIMHSVFLFIWVLSWPIKGALLEDFSSDGFREISISSQHGSVEGDTFVYFTIRFVSKSASNSGLFQRIELHSIEGDADLYVSSGHRPTWANYALCSRTTGLDVIWASSRLERPLQVGVFGNPAHNHSDFELRVVDLRGFLPAVEEPPISYYERVTYEQLDRESHAEVPAGGAADISSTSSKGNADTTIASDPDSPSILYQIGVIIFKIILEVLA